MIELLIAILIVVLILIVAFWIVQQMGLPPPARQVALVIVGLIGLLAILNYLPGSVVSLPRWLGRCP